MTSVGFAVLGLIVGAALGGVIAARLVARRARFEAITQQREHARKRFAELGAMTAGLAHEIKNPLSTIGLNAQLLAESISESDIAPDDKSRMKRRIDTVQREIDRLRSILTDFLDFAGQIHIEPRTLDLNSIVDELIEFFLPQAEQQGVRLRAMLSPSPLLAAIDPVPFKQAVLNLMLNAVQAMKNAPGELIIRTESLSDSDGSPMAAVHVIDTGPGISPEVAERIFQPYFTTKSGGSGLGLPLARRLVEAHNGRIDVHSEPGRGTDFTIAIPMAEPMSSP